MNTYFITLPKLLTLLLFLLFLLLLLFLGGDYGTLTTKDFKVITLLTIPTTVQPPGWGDKRCDWLAVRLFGSVGRLKVQHQVLGRVGNG